MAAGLVGLAIGTAAWFRVQRSVVVSPDPTPVFLPETRIDLNTAGAAELDLLPSIGPRLAERILADRQANGPFGSIEELARVPGIGPKVVARIRPYTVANTP